MAVLSKAALLESQSFVAALPEPKDITWTTYNEHGEECQQGPYTVYVRQRSYSTATAEMRAIYEGDQSDAGLAVAARIAACIVDEQGRPLFTMADIIGNDEHGPINDSLTSALLAAIGEVNGHGQAKKNSSPKTNSGANSSSPASVATPSPKRKTTSQKPKS